MLVDLLIYCVFLLYSVTAVVEPFAQKLNKKFNVKFIPIISPWIYRRLFDAGVLVRLFMV